MSLRWTEEEYTRYTGRVLPAPVTPPAPVSEEVWQAAVMKVAKDAGFLAYHTYRSRKSAEGFPDIVLCHAIAGQGHPLYLVELKTDTGIVSQAQAAWLEALAGCTGVVAEVWRPADMAHVIDMLRR